MTKWDVKNYLEKIYKIPVVTVKTHVKCGDIKKAKGNNYLIKEDDYKVAIVDLVCDGLISMFTQTELIRISAERCKIRISRPLSEGED